MPPTGALADLLDKALATLTPYWTTANRLNALIAASQPGVERNTVARMRSTQTILMGPEKIIGWGGGLRQQVVLSGPTGREPLVGLRIGQRRLA
jgi:hypothetical protein